MTGVDIDDAALSLAREKCDQSRLPVRLVNEDLATWVPDDSYDAVIAPNNVLKWMRNRDLLRRCIAQSALALRPGGIALFDLTIEPTVWKSLDWGTEADMAEHAWVSRFQGPGISGEYRCFMSVPDAEEIQAPYVERFVCQDHGEQIVLEERTAWLLFTARQLAEWISETGSLGDAKFYERGKSVPVEIAIADLDREWRQCLIASRKQ